MFSCHSRYCFACKTQSYIRKGVCANPNCVPRKRSGGPEEKEWWARKQEWWATKQKKRNKGLKRKVWWARKQGWISPPPDTGATSSAGGKGPTSIETQGLQASSRINSFALQVSLGHSILLPSYRKLTQWF